MLAWRTSVRLGLDPEELIKATSKAPNVRGSVILFFKKRNFGSSIPSRANVARETSLLAFYLRKLALHLARDHLSNLFLREFLVITVLINWFSNSSRVTTPGSSSTFRKSTGKTHVANLYLTIFIQKNVRGLDIAMENVHGVHVLKSTKQVVHYQHDMVFFKATCLSQPKKLPQIGLLIFHDQKDVFDIRFGSTFREYHVYEFGEVAAWSMSRIFMDTF